jgi:hypothetical protein
LLYSPCSRCDFLSYSKKIGFIESLFCQNQNLQTQEFSKLTLARRLFSTDFLFFNSVNSDSDRKFYECVNFGIAADYFRLSTYPSLCVITD